MFSRACQFKSRHLMCLLPYKSKVFLVFSLLVFKNVISTCNMYFRLKALCFYIYLYEV